jgi:hypothetical protein
MNGIPEDREPDTASGESLRCAPHLPLNCPAVHGHRSRWTGGLDDPPPRLLSTCSSASFSRLLPEPREPSHCLATVAQLSLSSYRRPATVAQLAMTASLGTSDNPFYYALCGGAPTLEVFRARAREWEREPLAT